MAEFTFIFKTGLRQSEFMISVTIYFSMRKSFVIISLCVKLENETFNEKK